MDERAAARLPPGESGRRNWIRTCCAALGIALCASPAIANGQPAVCGQPITSDLKLENDLTCNGTHGLRVRAENITIDLNGHTLTGIVSPIDTGLAGITTGRGHRDFRIMNGTIVGFNRGIDVANSSGVVIQDVTIRDPVMAHGIAVTNSTDVRIRNVSLVGPSPWMTQAAAIWLTDAVAVNVQNVTSTGFGEGIHFWTSSGSVRDSFLSDAYAGIGIDGATSVTISGNTIWSMAAPDGGAGGIGGGYTAPVSHLRIVDNTVIGSARGIYFHGITDSTIAGNTLSWNWYAGIELSAGASGNRISANTAFGNGTDLWHDESSTPNLWLDNVCSTTFGADATCVLTSPE